MSVKKISSSKKTNFSLIQDNVKNSKVKRLTKKENEKSEMKDMEQHKREEKILEKREQEELETKYANCEEQLLPSPRTQRITPTRRLSCGCEIRKAKNGLWIEVRCMTHSLHHYIK